MKHQLAEWSNRENSYLGKGGSNKKKNVKHYKYEIESRKWMQILLYKIQNDTENVPYQLTL